MLLYFKTKVPNFALFVPPPVKIRGGVGEVSRVVTKVNRRSRWKFRISDMLLPFKTTTHHRRLRPKIKATFRTF